MTVKRRMLDALNRVLAPTGFSLHRWKNPRTILDAGHPMTRALCASGCFDREPVSVIDAGCAGGIDERWRVFGSRLRAWGIDAMTAECARLRNAESNAGVKYIDARIEMASDRPAQPQPNPWSRLSTPAALAFRRSRERGGDEALRSNQWHEQALSQQKLSVNDLIDAHGIDALDFLKIDLDGPDYEVLAGFAPHLDRMHTLGVKVEVNFFGTAQEDVHSFHNTDRLLRAHGFELFGLTGYNYSNAALPAAFAAGVLGPTVFGRVLQGDALYFRDAAGDAGPGALSPTKLLKLACMFELFDLPDCAAEILLRFREHMGRSDTAQLLDLLVPRLDGAKLGHEEYMARFNSDPRSFI
jgi:hypothetical protein